MQSGTVSIMHNITDSINGMESSRGIVIVFEDLSRNLGNIIVSKTCDVTFHRITGVLNGMDI